MKITDLETFKMLPNFQVTHKVTVFEKEVVNVDKIGVKDN